MYLCRLCSAFKLSRYSHQARQLGFIQTLNQADHPTPHTFGLVPRVPFFWRVGGGVHRINVKSELSPCFLQSLLLIFLLFSSANLFKLLSPFLLSPSLISKPLSLRAAGAQLCVFDCMCVCIRVCACAVVWVFSGTVLPHRT